MKSSTFELGLKESSERGLTNVEKRIVILAAVACLICYFR